MTKYLLHYLALAKSCLQMALKLYKPFELVHKPIYVQNSIVFGCKSGHNLRAKL